MDHGNHLRPGRLAFAAGTGALAAQVLIVRELMVSFYGTEQAIAAAFCTWLALVAAGAGLGALVVRRAARARPLCAAAAVCLAIGIWPGWLAARLVRCLLGAEVGAFIPTGCMVAGAAVAALPCALAVGFFFPCAAVVAEERADHGGRGTGRVYLLEAIGSALAGALLSLVLLGRLNPVAILGLASGAVLLAVTLFGGVRPLGRTLLGCAGVGVLVAGFWGGPVLDRRSAKWRWTTVSTFRREASISTRYQYVELGARQGEWVLVRNGRAGEQFPDRRAMRQCAALILTQHPDPRRVLLVGGGLTGLCQAVLQAPVARLDYVEPDPRAMAFTRRHLPVADRDALRDERFTAIGQDGRAFVRAAALADRRYDIICLNVGDPASAAESRFYTVDFFRQAARCLGRDGVLAVTGITGSANYLERGPAQDYAACLYASLRNVFSHVAVSPGESLSFFAAAAPDVATTDPDVVGARFQRMGLQPALMRFALSVEAFPPERVTATQAALAARAHDAPVNTDRRPLLFARFLALQAAYAGPSRGGARPSGRSGAVPAGIAALTVIAGLAVLAFVGLRRRRGGPRRSAPVSAGVAVLTTGAFGLTAELLIIYGYQVTFGYVYRDIALLTGLFMFGLSCGAAVALRAQPLMPYRLLVLAEAAQVVFALSVPALSGAAWAAPIVFAAASFVAGGLTGAVLPSAATVVLGAGVRPATAAGWLDAADHGGAVVGAATAGLLLLPLLGLGATAVLLATLKVTGLAALLLGGRLQAAARP